MRSVISRAVTRKSDDLLRSIRELLVGKPVTVGTESAAAFSEEICEAEGFVESKIGKSLNAGYVEVMAHPTMYDAKRIRSLPDVQAAIRGSEVALRGWNFPHTDKQDAAAFGRGIPVGNYLGSLC